MFTLFAFIGIVIEIPTRMRRHIYLNSILHTLHYAPILILFENYDGDDQSRSLRSKIKLNHTTYYKLALKELL